MPLRRRRPRADLAMILGCQRSGTTLLGLMLEAHPGVDLIEENDSVAAIGGRVAYCTAVQ